MRTEGGYGFLIVNEAKPIATYDAEMLVVLTDWYHQTASFEHAGINNYCPLNGVPKVPSNVTVGRDYLLLCI